MHKMNWARIIKMLHLFYNKKTVVSYLDDVIVSLIDSGCDQRVYPLGAFNYFNKRMPTVYH